MGKATFINLRTVKNHDRPQQVKAVDDQHYEWVRITDADFPGEKCGICGQILDEGWMQLYAPQWMADACPCVICKRHCIVNGIKPPKYRSIDDE